MTRFLTRRLLALVIQILLITFVVWFIFFIIATITGATPAQRFAGRYATPQRIAQVAKVLGTNKPYWEQYFLFLWHAVQGNLGYSYLQQRPVVDILLPAAAATASVVLGGMVGWMLIAIVIGSYGALRPRSLGDVLGRAFAIVGMSLPLFLVAPMLALFLAFQPTQGQLFGLHILPVGTHLFPIDGYVPLAQNPVQWAYHLILPWLALSITYAAVYARYIRTLTIENLAEDYVRTAEAKGVGRMRLLSRHVGRNVAPVTLTVLAADVGGALGGIIFVESVFNIPGLGYTGLSAIENLDYPLVAGVVLFAGVVAVLANAIVDLIHGLLDPRVRLGR